MTEQRVTISAADAEAIARALIPAIKDEIYRDLGKGLWSKVVGAVITVCLAVAAYGSLKGVK